MRNNNSVTFLLWKLPLFLFLLIYVSRPLFTDAFYKLLAKIGVSERKLKEFEAKFDLKELEAKFEGNSP